MGEPAKVSDPSALHGRKLPLTVTLLSWGQEPGETDSGEEGGEEIAEGQARNDQIPRELYLHSIFLYLLILVSHWFFLFFSLG